MSLIMDMADAMVNTLNAHDFNKPFVAERLYVPMFDLKDMKDLRVSVVPRGVDTAIESRALVKHDVMIDVAVQQKLATEGNAEIDALMNLTQEIADHVRQRRSIDNCYWLKTENDPIYSPEHISGLRQFTSVLTFTFRAVAA